MARNTLMNPSANPRSARAITTRGTSTVADRGRSRRSQFTVDCESMRPSPDGSASRGEEVEYVGERAPVLRHERVTAFVDAEFGPGDARRDGLRVRQRCDAVEATGRHQRRARDPVEPVEHVESAASVELLPLA